MQTQITPDLVRAALLYIPANLPRDDWAKIGMAIKSEYPDDTGRDLFTDWSATAEGFNARATAGTWRSIKAGGGVRINTLLYRAKEHGFEIPKPNQAATPPSAEAVALQKQHQAERLQAEQAAINAAHAAAATDAAARWAQASPTGHSPYLNRKGVLPHGVRFDASGGLLVPVCDVAGQLWNIQRIAPAKPDDGGPDKLFLKGGRKSGLWHWLGAAGEVLAGAVGDAATGMQPAPQIDPSGLPVPPAVLLVAEGYATAASLFEATGYPCAVAFDAGNLAAVSKALRQQYPATLMVLCGDDDVQTFATKGHNPGRDKATAAAKAVQGIAVFPSLLPDGGSDFNDLHAARGLDTVRRIVQAAIDHHRAQQQQAMTDPTPATSKPPKPPKPGKGPARRNAPGADLVAPGSDADGMASDGVRVPLDRFLCDESGLWYTPPGDDGNGAPKRICDALRVLGEVSDIDNNNVSLLLEFDTGRAKARRWLMPMAMLSGDGTGYRTILLGMGFKPPTVATYRAYLTQYLLTRKNLPLMRHTSRVGWFGDGANTCYVLPGETLGNTDGEKVIFYNDKGRGARYAQRGSLALWQEQLSSLCIGNSRLALAVSVAFAGPLLAWAPGTSGGGFHYKGTSSVGKTTGLLLAASVWGKASERDGDTYIQKWKTTETSLEGLAEQHSDGVLILDELAQMDPNKMGEAAYMLADGMGKARGQAQGGNRPVATWRVLYLSTGEVSPAEHMDSVGKKIKGGQEVRLITIPAEVEPGTSLEKLHHFDTGHDFSNHVQTHAAKRYGTAGRAWLEWLVANIATLRPRLEALMDGIEVQLVPPGAEGQVRRAVKRFALVAAAGELATQQGLTGWPEGTATWAVQTCLGTWLQARGGAGNSERAAMLRQVRMFFETQGEARFTWFHRAMDDHSAKTLNRAGFRMLIDSGGSNIKTNNQHQVMYGEGTPPEFIEDATSEFYVLPEVFKSEVCKGFDPEAVCRLLLELGCLTVSPSEPGRFSMKAKLPGMGASGVRCYRVTAGVYSLDV
ncbi:DUF927 domain-containing protein [Rhodoferax sp.]|uniref:DUF927 domain-containing protein n=1 Tax=Rhodoferax sp. TaxID=50421 RepID=UPI0025E0E3CC|nr:DUF927 domain-containing protein [Rhodoferax sp.]